MGDGGSAWALIWLKMKAKADMSGNFKKLWFHNDDLERMRVTGQARCRYVPMGEDEGSEVNIGGDVLDVLFEGGDLTHIEADGQVRGEYLHPQSNEKP